MQKPTMIFAVVLVGLLITALIVYTLGEKPTPETTDPSLVNTSTNFGGDNANGSGSQERRANPRTQNSNGITLVNQDGRWKAKI